MAKKWYPELWRPLGIEIKIPKDQDGPPKEHKGFWFPENPEDGYEVRGIYPTDREIEDPQYESY